MAAMPTLIMRAVPLTETASANGLNVLLRSLGTSTASATIAAVTSASMVTVAGRPLPSGEGLSLLLWTACAAAMGAALVSAPMIGMQDFADEGSRGNAVMPGRPLTVVHGEVLDSSARPIPSAVVTLLTLNGAPVDWGQADSAGRFAAAIPGPDDYLVVTAADGWQPRSRVMRLDSDGPLPPIVLRDRLTLSGTISDSDGQPSSSALVILTRNSGEAVDSIRTDHNGRYEIPRPANGRYVLTVLTRGGAMGARPVTVWEAARSVDLTIGTPLV